MNQKSTASLFLPLLFLSLSKISFAQSGAWSQLADFPSFARENAVGFGLNAKVYFGTGASTDGYKNDFWEYDPANDSWTQKSDLPAEPREMAVGFAISGVGYLGLGLGDIGELNDLWSYDPNSNTWLQRKDFEGGERYAAFSNVSDGLAYVGLGRNGSGILTEDFWSYSPISDDWVQLTNFLGGAREFASSFAIPGKVYVGLGNSTLIGVKNDLYEYDVSLNTWTQKTGLPGTARSSAVSYAFESFGVIGLGNDASINELQDFWQYDTENDVWTEVLSFPGGGRFGASIASLDGLAYVIGGSNGLSRFNDLWRFDADFELETPSLTKAAIISDTRSYIEWRIEDSNAEGFIIQRSTEGTTNFENIESVDEPTTFFIDTGMPTGTDVYYRVIATGSGVDSSPSASLRSEPDGLWSRLNDFSEGKRSSSVSFAYAGLGYMGGGFSQAEVADFWSYDPENDTWTQLADIDETPLTLASSFVVEDQAFIVLGAQNGSFVNEVRRYDFNTNTWTILNPFEGLPRRNQVSFVINNEPYVGLGSNSSFSTYTDLWKYDVATDDWAEVASLPGGIGPSVFSFSSDGIGYVGDRQFPNQFWSYDPTNDLWTRLNDLDFGAFVSSSFIIGNKAYVTVNQSSTLIETWEYDVLTDSWRRRADFPGLDRNSAVNFSIDGLAYFGFGSPGGVREDFWRYEPGVIGLQNPTNLEITNVTQNSMAISWDDNTDDEIGFLLEFSTTGTPDKEWLTTEPNVTSVNIDGLSANTTYFWRVKAITDQAESGASNADFENTGPNWVRKKDFPGKILFEASEFAIAGNIYYYEGALGSQTLWTFDPDPGEWTQRAEFPGAPRNNASTIVIGHKVYLIGGDTGSYSSEVWEYDSQVNLWTQKQDFPGEPRIGSSGVELQGIGYLFFGETTINGENNLSEVWEYTPGTDTWIRKNDFPGPASRRGSAHTIDDKIFVALGDPDGNTDEQDNFFQYTPGTDEWEKKSDAPASSLMAFSAGGKIFGVNDNSGGHSFYEYDITNDAWISRGRAAGNSFPRAAVSSSDQAFLGFNGLSQEFWQFIPAPYNVRGFARAEIFETATIRLIWDDNNDEDGYIVERSVDEINFIFLDSLAANDTVFFDASLSPGKRYYYRYQAFNQFGNSPYSRETSRALPELPQAPTNLTFSFASLDRIDLQWVDQSSNETRFEMERSIGTNGNFEVIDTIAANNIVYTDTDIEINQTYSYRVRAFNESGPSEYSNMAQEIITSLAPAQSEVIIYPNPSSGIFNLNNVREFIEHVELISIAGQVVRSKTVIGSASSVNFWGVPTGTYLLRIKTSKNEIIEKVVVE